MTSNGGFFMQLNNIIVVLIRVSKQSLNRFKNSTDRWKVESIDRVELIDNGCGSIVRADSIDSGVYEVCYHVNLDNWFALKMVLLHVKHHMHSRVVTSSAPSLTDVDVISPSMLILLTSLQWANDLDMIKNGSLALAINGSGLQGHGYEEWYSIFFLLFEIKYNKTINNSSYTTTGCTLRWTQ